MDIDKTVPAALRLGVCLRPMPQIAGSPFHEAPPRAMRRVFGSRLRALVLPYIDIPIPAYLQNTPGGDKAASEKAELLTALTGVLREYAEKGAPSILEIAAPGGWNFHIDLAAPADELGKAEVGVLAAARLITVGSTVRAAAASTETRFADGWGAPTPANRFQFSPLPPPKPPALPDYATTLRLGQRPATVAPATLKAQWLQLSASVKQKLGMQFHQLPRSVTKAAVDYHMRGGPPWTAIFPRLDGRRIVLDHTGRIGTPKSQRCYGETSARYARETEVSGGHADGAQHVCMSTSARRLLLQKEQIGAVHSSDSSVSSSADSSADS